MKRYLFYFSLALFIYSCGNQATQNNAESDASLNNTDLLQMNIKGKVQTMTESSYTADSTGNTDKVDSVSSEYSFDEKGYLQKQSSKDLSGVVTDENNYSRNDKGSLTELSTTKKGKLTFRLVTDIGQDGLTYTGGKTFDSTGKQDSYYKDLKTNEYGIVYAGKQYKMDSSIKNEWDMKFDKANFIGGSSKDSTGKTSYTGSVVLNEKGDPAEETSTTWDKDSTKTEKFTYTYDKTDEKGNWIQRTVVKDNKPSKVLKRVFVYYKN